MNTLIVYCRYPKELLREGKPLERGEWVAVNATLDEVQLQACLFKDLKEKQFLACQGRRNTMVMVRDLRLPSITSSMQHRLIYTIMLEPVRLASKMYL